MLLAYVFVLAGGKSCGKCSGCLAVECGKCKNCRDKTKFGGSGRKKQKCVMKTCGNPSATIQDDHVRHFLGNVGVHVLCVCMYVCVRMRMCVRVIPYTLFYINNVFSIMIRRLNSHSHPKLLTPIPLVLLHNSFTHKTEEFQALKEMEIVYSVLYR